MNFDKLTRDKMKGDKMIVPKRTADKIYKPLIYLDYSTFLRYL